MQGAPPSTKNTSPAPDPGAHDHEVRAGSHEEAVLMAIGVRGTVWHEVTSFTDPEISHRQVFRPVRFRCLGPLRTLSDVTDQLCADASHTVRLMVDSIALIGREFEALQITQFWLG